eukprot:jgi/Botrbrau1/16208/Bobra.314_2s0002.1
MGQVMSNIEFRCRLRYQLVPMFQAGASCPRFTCCTPCCTGWPTWSKAEASHPAPGQGLPLTYPTAYGNTMGMLPGELAETLGQRCGQECRVNTKVKTYQAFHQTHRGERPATGRMRDFLLRLPENFVLPPDCTLGGAYKVLNENSKSMWPFLETMVYDYGLLPEDVVKTSTGLMETAIIRLCIRNNEKTVPRQLHSLLPGKLDSAYGDLEKQVPPTPDSADPTIPVPAKWVRPNA